MFACDGTRRDEGRPHTAASSATEMGWRRLQRIHFPEGGALSFHGFAIAAVGDDSVAVGSWRAVPETDKSLFAPSGSARSSSLRLKTGPSAYLSTACNFSQVSVRADKVTSFLPEAKVLTMPFEI